MGGEIPKGKIPNEIKKEKIPKESLKEKNPKGMPRGFQRKGKQRKEGVRCSRRDGGSRHPLYLAVSKGTTMDADESKQWATVFGLPKLVGKMDVARWSMA